MSAFLRQRFIANILALMCVAWIGLPLLSASGERPPISILFLMDSSGSMKDNDPDGIRVAAAQAVVTLLSAQDEVSVVQFDSGARALTFREGKVWLSASERASIFAALQNLGRDGQFTDFRVALDSAAEVFAGVPSGRRKVVLLLTDGILEPNPNDESYAPHHLSYQMDLLRAGARGRRKVNEEYRQRLTPIARRLLSERTLPRLRSRGVEVHCVGLSPSSDAQFLEWIANQTTSTPTEVHAFHAEKATDLVAVFARLLQYWTESVVFHDVGGPIIKGTAGNVYLDEYVSQPRALTLVEGRGEFFIQSPDGISEQKEPGTHPKLGVFHLSRSNPPTTWRYGFKDGEGTYRTLVVGGSGLKLVLSGLKGEYQFREEVRVAALIEPSGGSNALPPTGARVLAELTPMGNPAGTLRQEFVVSSEGHVFRHTPPQAGRYAFRATAELVGRGGRPVLPRQGIRYQFEVLPSLYVVPSTLEFGEGRQASVVSRDLEIHSGLAARTELRLSGRITGSSSAAFRRSEVARLPSIREETLSVEPGTVTKRSVTMNVPKKADWGDYEGQIEFRAADKAVYTIPFSLHVPSLWERIRLWIAVIGLLALLALAYLVWVWGCLRTPSGTLIPVGNCPGILRESVRLGSARRNWFSRWLHWRRNRLRLSELPLPDRPRNLDAELTFYAWGPIFIQNLSRAREFEIREPGGTLFRLKSSRSLRLRHQAILRMGECEYRYEAARR